MNDGREKKTPDNNGGGKSGLISTVCACINYSIINTECMHELVYKLANSFTQGMSESFNLAIRPSLSTESAWDKYIPIKASWYCNL